MAYYDLFACTVGAGFAQVKRVDYKRGGPEELNRALARSHIRVLLDPLDSGKMSMDSATLQVAKDNDITIAISFRQFLTAGRFKRIRLLVSYRKLVQLCLRMRNRIVLTSGAEDELELRSPEQLIAFGVFLGLTRPQAKWAISEAPTYAMEATR